MRRNSWRRPWSLSLERRMRWSSSCKPRRMRRGWFRMSTSNWRSIIGIIPLCQGTLNRINRIRRKRFRSSKKSWTFQSKEASLEITVTISSCKVTIRTNSRRKAADTIKVCTNCKIWAKLKWTIRSIWATSTKWPTVAQITRRKNSWTCLVPQRKCLWNLKW